MDDANVGGGAAEHRDTSQSVDEAWRELMAGLAGVLERMGEDEHLLLEMPAGRGPGCTPYAQFAGFDGGAMLHAELSGNTFLSAAHQLSDEWCDSLRLMGWRGNDDEPNWFVEHPTKEAAVVAAMVVGALREAFGVEHPLLLTYESFGPNADAALLLGLSATEDVPVESAPVEPAPVEPTPQLPTVVTPSDHDTLVKLVRMTLHARLGEMPMTDDDGDVVLTHLGQPVWVRVRDDQPAVEIMARVAHGVHSRRATAAELSVLNRDHVWTSWVLSGRDVYLRLPIPAYPFVPGHLVAMLDVFLAAMTETRDDLAFRVGGRVA
jgi:hypothetical protein